MGTDDRFMRAVEIVLEHEGKLVNDPQDPGGITDYGISLRYLQSLCLIRDEHGYMLGDLDHDGDIDADDVRKMTKEEAIEIYHTQWWDRYGYGRINDDPLAFKVFDLAVNMGPGRANRMLQQAVRKACVHPSACSMVVDGLLGPKTIDCVNHCASATASLNFFKQLAVEFYQKLNRPHDEAGWIRRATE
jgi:lysozyme family protein